MRNEKNGCQLNFGDYMNEFIKKSFGNMKKGLMSFERYPASIIFAFFLAVTAIITIHTEPEQSKLHESLMLSFASASVLGMVFSVAAKKITGQRNVFLWTNAAVIIPFGIVFSALYFPSGQDIPEISLMRVWALIAISFLVFLFVPTLKESLVDFNNMVFITVRSFFTSVVYTTVMVVGFFFVAFAVRALIYEDLSQKIFAYIAILSAFVGYSFFLGLFPDFTDNTIENGQETEAAIKQPKFAKILFQYIMIPIVGAMAVVLFIWSLRILFTGDWPDYDQVVAIFTTYSLTGIWLYFLVSSSDAPIVGVYKNIFPVSALIFLAFEAYPIFERIALYGVTPSDYGVLSLWLFAAVSCVILLFVPGKRNRAVSYIAIFLIAVFVMPVVGAKDFSYANQGRHLERILLQNDMLDDGRIKPGFEISEKDKRRITIAVEYLLGEENKTPPDYLANSLSSFSLFRQTFGFEPVYWYDRIPEPGEKPDGRIDYLFISLGDYPIDIKDYDYRIGPDKIAFGETVFIKTDMGEYGFSYFRPEKDDNDLISYPVLSVKLDGNTIIEYSIEEFADKLRETFSLEFETGPDNVYATAGEMSFEKENEDIRVKAVFSSVSLSRDGSIPEYFNLESLYFAQKDRYEEETRE